MTDFISNTSSKIMTKLDHNKLHDLKEQFRNKEEGLLLEEFVGVMLAFIDEQETDWRGEGDDALILNIIELFKQIDVNDDGSLEWEEFSNHIIESGMSKRESKFVDQIKHYFPSPIEDTSRHEHEVEHIFFFPRLKYFFVMERDLKDFKVYTTKKLTYVRTVSGHRGNITSAEHIWDRDLLATCANDLSIILWDLSTWQKKGRIMTNDIQLVLKQHRDSGNRHCFMSAGIDFHIHFQNLDTLKPTKVIQPEKVTRTGQFFSAHHHPTETSDTDKPEKRAVGAEYYGHTSAIVDILIVPSRDLFFTCGMDAKIVCWDLKIQTQHREFLGHKKGVLSLAWINDCLISAGLDREAQIWNPQVSKKIQALKGHQHSLIGVKALEESNQIITADISAAFKVWDSRNLSCVQTFHMGSNDVQCFTITEPHHRIIGGFKKLVYQEQDEPKDQNLVDENPALNVFFNREFFVFITIHATCIKMWNAKDGKLSTVLRELTKQDIVKGIMDHRQRKIFLADTSGRVASYNLNNGAKMKKFKDHDQEVSDLQQYGENKNLVTCGWDGQLLISDDDAPVREAKLLFKTKPEGEDGKKENIKPFNCTDIFQCVQQERNKITGRVHDVSLTMLAVGSSEGKVLLLDMSTHRQVAALHQNQSITKLKFFANHPLLAVADDSGRVCLQAVKPSPLAAKQTPLIEFTNSYTIGGEEQNNVPIKCMDYYEVPVGPDESRAKQLKLLVLGDTNGVVSIQNLSTIVEKHIAQAQSFLSGDKDSTFATEVDSHTDEFVIKKEELVLTRLYRAHYSAIIDLRVDENLKPIVLMTSSLDCEVYIWDLVHCARRETPQADISPVGSLVIQGLKSQDEWRIKPDIDQKTRRQREMKHEILDQALKIRNAIQKEQSIFNKVREQEESGILDEVTKNLEEKMRRKDIDLRFLIKAKPDTEKKQLQALANINQDEMKALK